LNYYDQMEREWKGSYNRSGREQRNVKFECIRTEDDEVADVRTISTLSSCSATTVTGNGSHSHYCSQLSRSVHSISYNEELLLRKFREDQGRKRRSERPPNTINFPKQREVVEKPFVFHGFVEEKENDGFILGMEMLMTTMVILVVILAVFLQLRGPDE